MASRKLIIQLFPSWPATEPAIHRARVCGRGSHFDAQTRAGWVAGSSPAMTIERA
jgi:hypothetical protein